MQTLQIHPHVRTALKTPARSHLHRSSPLLSQACCSCCNKSLMAEASSASSNSRRSLRRLKGWGEQIRALEDTSGVQRVHGVVWCEGQPEPHRCWARGAATLAGQRKRPTGRKGSIVAQHLQQLCSSPWAAGCSSACCMAWRKSSGKGANNSNACPVTGCANAKRNACNAWRCKPCNGVLIQCICPQRMAQMSHVNTNLVCASGISCNAPGSPGPGWPHRSHQCAPLCQGAAPNLPPPCASDYADRAP